MISIPFSRCRPQIPYSSPARPDRSSSKVCVHVDIQGTISPKYAVSYHVQRDIVIFFLKFYLLCIRSICIFKHFNCVSFCVFIATCVRCNTRQRFICRVSIQEKSTLSPMRTFYRHVLESSTISIKKISS